MSKTYTDTFDSTRTVVPIRDTAQGTECKVYFNGHYSGKTFVPRHLLVERPTNDRDVRHQHFYGFVADK